MRGRKLVAVTAVGVTVGLLGPAAAGGGWWSSIQIDAPHVGVGETVTITSDVLFDSAEAAQVPRDYYAYLLQGVDERMIARAMETGEPGDWWTPPPGGRVVGGVTLSDLDANVATATARATIPGVEPGDYSLMLCTAGCAEPLANVVPAVVRVSPDPVLAARVRALTARKWRQMHAVAVARRRLEVSRGRVDDLNEALGVQTRRGENLDERVRELSAALQRDDSGGSGSGGEVAAALVAGLVAGALGAAGLGRVRRLRSRGGVPAEPAVARR